MTERVFKERGGRETRRVSMQTEPRFSLTRLQNNKEREPLLPEWPEKAACGTACARVETPGATTVAIPRGGARVTPWVKPYHLAEKEGKMILWKREATDIDRRLQVEHCV